MTEEKTNEKTPTKKHKALPPLFQSEFSMGELEFKRFYSLFAWKDMCALHVNGLNPDYCQQYYAVLLQIYKNIRWLFKPSTKEQLDTAFKVLRVQINVEILSKKGTGNKISSLSYKLLDLFNEIDMKLMSVKQISGLGIRVKRAEGEYTKLKKALGL